MVQLQVPEYEPKYMRGAVNSEQLSQGTFSAKRKIFNSSARLKKNTTKFPNTEKRAENTTRSRVFLTIFK